MAGIDDTITAMLIPLLGKLTGPKALQLAKQKANIVGTTTRNDIDALGEALLPMLRPLAGSRAARYFLAELRKL